MAKTLEGINPDILKWARERAGYTIEDVAHALKREIKEITNWELGITAPTYSQLEKLSYQLYKRPIAVFFFPEPPPETDPVQSFRTLPKFEIDNLLPDSLYAIRLGEAMQFALKDMNDGVNPSNRKIFKEIRAHQRDNIYSLVELVRNYLGISLIEQKRWNNNEEALKKWRDIVQDVGIFIFKRSFKQRDISGYCLFDQEFPLIYLNNGPRLDKYLAFSMNYHIYYFMQVE